LFCKFFGALFCFINPDDLSPPQLIQIIEGLLYKEEYVSVCTVFIYTPLHVFQADLAWW
jgi:hypothetical protein